MVKKLLNISELTKKDMKYYYEGKNYSKEELLTITSKIGERIRIAIELVEGNNILDIGCGIGILANRLSKNLNMKIVGIDMLESNIQIARDLFKQNNISFIKMKAEDMKLHKNSFDCVTMLEVIEHVNNPAKVLRDCYNLLKPNGKIIISTPNCVSSYNITSTLIRTKNDLKRLKNEKRDTGTETDHIFSWELYTLYRLLDMCGFEYVTHNYCDGMFSKFPLNLKRLSRTIIVKFKKK